ncbi:hypothetical protein VitviT2T_017239 [Vitis vinifera]|uniref:Uncharacterized protein n=1 Tax=Vitis vinifera TaxID=29760 RepID=A0ABY9CUE4_VITVI|nr:hypothetical protein VitviT2T_017239 [Vitis vinifera]
MVRLDLLRPGGQPRQSSAMATMSLGAAGAGAKEHVFRANPAYFEPTVIDEVEPGAHRQLFCSGKLSGVKEDAIDNSAPGHYTLEKENINLYLNRIKNLANNCVDLQVLQVFSGGWKWY